MIFGRKKTAIKEGEMAVKINVFVQWKRTVQVLSILHIFILIRFPSGVN